MSMFVLTARPMCIGARINTHRVAWLNGHPPGSLCDISGISVACMQPLFEQTLDTLSRLGLPPPMLEAYREFLGTLDHAAELPPHVLAGCCARVAGIHGLAPLDDAAGADPAETAALALAERIPFQHHELTDAEMAAVADQFGAAGAVALLTAVAFFDATCRLQIALQPAVETRA